MQRLSSKINKGLIGLICMVLLSGMVSVLLSCGGGGGGGGSSNGDNGGNGGNNSPNPQIVRPFEGDTFTVGNTIWFAGNCSDSEDGNLIGDSLVWSSDLDGQIGTGVTCASDALSEGTHQITLTATDSNGAVGMDTILITVNADNNNGSEIFRLPDTGQTTPTPTIVGDDADYNINPPSYTKLDASGNELDDSASDWVMVRDNVTGFIWEVKTDNDNVHDKYNSYHWQHIKNDFIDKLNSDNFGGYSDWRLPSIKELSTLVNAGTSTGYSINEFYFPNTDGSYWSSTVGRWAGNYLYVKFSGGVVSESFMSDMNLSVRAVRGDKVSSNLVDNGDDTITDTATGLMWQQLEIDRLGWYEALEYCESLELADHNDWRLPNRNELQSVVDYTQEFSPKIDGDAFPSASSTFYWSSTIYIRGVGFWHVNFATGHVGYNLSYSGQEWLGRCVRGGQ